MKLSPHFTDSECACRCGCGKCDVSPRLLMLAEKIRDIFHAPLVTHSVCRCEVHNERVKGVKNSQHLKGKAMDFHVKGLESAPEVVYNSILRAYQDGLLPELGALFLYDWGVHIDVRACDGRLKTGNYRSDKHDV